ncbi:MAG: transcription-repair coupling factor [Alphaproteobacteria bacterium]
MSLKDALTRLTLDKPQTLSGAVPGFDGLVLGELAKKAHQGNLTLIHIAKDDARAETLKTALAFFAPDVTVLNFPAWDVLPYDRTGPRSSILAERLGVLSDLAEGVAEKAPTLILTTLNAALQRVPPKNWLLGQAIEIKVKNTLPREELSRYLMENGYLRVEAVAEPGDFAFRGSLVDLFPPHSDLPYRIDLFGDEVDTIRTFDPLSQRTREKVTGLKLLPAREFTLDEAARERFQIRYRETFGAALDEDPLYEAVKAGRILPGSDHWLPLFHETMETLFDYVSAPALSLDHKISDVVLQRLDDIGEYYLARKDSAGAAKTWSAPYKPLKPGALYLDGQDWQELLSKMNPVRLSPYPEPELEGAISLGGAKGKTFIAEREQKDLNIFEALKNHIKTLQKAGKKVLIGNISEASRERLMGVLRDHGMMRLEKVVTFDEAITVKAKDIAIGVLPLEEGYVAEGFALITETDILGDRIPRRLYRKKKAENFIREASSLVPGDLVVHITHGIGRFQGLETITADGTRHDCLKLTYQSGDRLFLPVENIEMLSRYGEGAGDHLLDKLGGPGWQVRHARMKKRIREMADKLIAIAAARSLRSGPVIDPPEGLYQEFAARFPFTETDDQLSAIEDVIDDLHKGRPMDRLICGDVGFGKTEVALRATMLAVMGGYQVAVISPTTLLSRQHTNTFSERFHGLPVVIEELSRLVTPSNTRRAKAAIGKGQADIVIGTHALLAKDIDFKNLGLLIVDEEQHFGVSHKERLKSLKADVHVLTLSATPIPRTLQMALAGLREMSLIATPPVDRLAIRTFVAPFDEVVIREALLREHYRGGQSYYVCPRVADLKEIADFLTEYIPEVKFSVAHGQMPARRIEDAMTAFYEGKYDVLLSTTIIESGLDIPNANTLVIHRADMFGLSQLYQLRGRVGRSKVRAYAYLTTPPRKPLTAGAEQRLHVLQSLDTLGAGFTLAAHDMDIRGAGNLLGEEQSGHIKEVGVELYQQMLEEAVASRKTGDVEMEEKWSPVINLGASVLIPEDYVSDLGLRLALYRRLAGLEDKEEIEDFGRELKDRFGQVPQEVKHLLYVTLIKLHCLRAGIEKIETGPKGVIIGFYKDRFANPAGLAEFLSSKKLKAKLRPDHKMIVFARWHDLDDRLKGVFNLVRRLADLAEG